MSFDPNYVTPRTPSHSDIDSLNTNDDDIDHNNNSNDIIDEIHKTTGYSLIKPTTPSEIFSSTEDSNLISNRNINNYGPVPLLSLILPTTPRTTDDETTESDFNLNHDNSNIYSGVIVNQSKQYLQPGNGDEITSIESIINILKEITSPGIIPNYIKFKLNKLRIIDLNLIITLLCGMIIEGEVRNLKNLQQGIAICDYSEYFEMSNSYYSALKYNDIKYHVCYLFC